MNASPPEAYDQVAQDDSLALTEPSTTVERRDHEALEPRVFSPSGVHCLCELLEVSPALLRDETTIMSALTRCVSAAGLTVLSETSHRFPAPGGGFTGVLLLAESHASVHTYPEHRYAALDLFTCGAHDPAPMLEALCRELSVTHYTLRSIARGAEVRHDERA